MTTPVRIRLQHLGRFAAHVGRRFLDDDCFSRAASLAYTTLLALVPLITIALTMATAFPVFQEFTSGVDDFFAQNMLPPTIAKAVTRYIDRFAHSAAGLTAVGVAFLAVTAIMLMLTIERAFDAIWRVRRPRPLVLRILMYWGVLTLGPLLIGMSLTLTSYLVSASLGFARQIPGAGSTLLGVVPVLLTAAAFALAYYVVPNRPLELRHAVIGGIAAAIMFELMKRGFAFYVAKFPTYTLVYGAFAAIPIFLIWIYASWVVAMLGAVITAALPDFHDPRDAEQATGAEVFRDALEILTALMLAQRASRTPRTREVIAEARVPRYAGEQLLNELAAAGWVARVVGDRWALACDPDVVTLADVYRRLVFEPGHGHAALDDVIRRAAAGAERAIAAPIRTLVDGSAGPGPRPESPPKRQDRQGTEQV